MQRILSRERRTLLHTITVLPMHKDVPDSRHPKASRRAEWIPGRSTFPLECCVGRRAAQEEGGAETVGTKPLLDPSPISRRDMKTKRHERSWCEGNRQCCGMGHKLMTDARFSGEARRESRVTLQMEPCLPSPRQAKQSNSICQTGKPMKYCL